MHPTTPYPIGTPGRPWGAAERAAWLARQTVQRSYADEVLAPLQAQGPAGAECVQYGELDYTALGAGRYPLMAVRSRDWRAGRPTVLVTGGVHGYETSGVQGALLWLRRDFERYAKDVNVLMLPAISPWAYETINRWNPLALDPNRLFRPDSPALEARLAWACVAAQAPQVDLHVDLHETTDSDNSEFGPARAARDGKASEWHEVPDGFYLVADSARPEPDFQRALIEAVARVTPIAAADPQGCLIGTPVQQPGVIHYDMGPLGLCGGMTAARLHTTTEVYPDSPRTTPAQCNEAQAVTVSRAIDYLLGA
ncbi:M14 family metallopeptidase [Inhella proteolytica]|uniref:M14 family metallocarboxypeptidase n=1 Tax=Inhella proteolytica TaxID=2795029 RepID=A0A931J503_9BURK|nr:M14 family metallocarboxypeptidase [Inhella proteolytica]MBH9576972.1 M14 family metallocarboxypeptidase [Inhella proteolytica]